MASFNIEDIGREAKSCYLEKLKLVNLDLCPCQIPADSWKNDSKMASIRIPKYLSLFGKDSWRIYKRIHEKQKELRSSYPVCWSPTP